MYEHILLPVDLNEKSSWEKALPVALTLAEDYKSTLHIVTVVPEMGLSIVGSFLPKGFEEKAKVDALKAVEKFCEEHIGSKAPHKAHIAQGPIYQKIIETADRVNCDLIVLAAHRPELSDYLLGPNAARVMRHANQSVMVVRG
jgi:nucleotide-binding universal stress UspA family protein